MRVRFLIVVALFFLHGGMVSAFGAKNDTVSLQPIQLYKHEMVKQAHSVEFRLDAQLPDAENAQLATVVRQWFSSLLEAQTTLTVEKAGLADKSGEDMGEYFADAYVKRSKKEIADLVKTMRRDTTEHHFNYSFDMTVKRAYETGRFITFLAETYVYTGGAHGIQYREYATYRKDNGHLVTWNDLVLPKKKKDFCLLVTGGLQKYFGVMDFTALREHLLLSEPYTRTSFPLPQGNPGLVEDGLRVQYGAYEIAPYAAGQPLVVIPYSSMKRLWSKVGLSLWK